MMAASRRMNRLQIPHMKMMPQTSQMTVRLAVRQRILQRIRLNSRIRYDTATAEAVVEAEETAPEATAAPQIGDTRTGEVNDALFLFVPGGEFNMGADNEREDEGPMHAVLLDAFWLMRDEVTNAQYQQCVQEGSCTAPASSDWDDPSRANHPVAHVTWEQANQYAEWAGGRLPTEAEWESAARGDDGRSYPWGEDTPDSDLLNFNFDVGDTTEVGTYPEGAGPFGHLDMAGNVEEWVADRYDGSYYAASPEANPLGPETGPLRVVRGGSYYSNGIDVRTYTQGEGATQRTFR